MISPVAYRKNRQAAYCTRPLLQRLDGPSNVRTRALVAAVGMTATALARSVNGQERLGVVGSLKQRVDRDLGEMTHLGSG
jgi:hypothetical protein